jgi:acetoacetate decarboxylase
MKESEVKKRAFAMPLTSPAYPIGPYRFYQREFLIVTTVPIHRSCASSCWNR